MSIEGCPPCKRRHEEFVRTCIAGVLGVPVCAHDDGRQDAMYDLAIRYADRPPAPVEVTSDVDEKAAGTINTLDKMYGQDAWDAPSLERSWALQTVLTSNLRQLKRHAERSLRELELAGLTQFESQVHRWESSGQAPLCQPWVTERAPNASVAAPEHPRYPNRRGSTTQPSAENPHHRSHSVTTVSLDLKSSERLPLRPRLWPAAVWNERSLRLTSGNRRSGCTQHWEAVRGTAQRSTSSSGSTNS